MGSATSLTLPSGHLAIGVTTRRLQRRRRYSTSSSRPTTPTFEEGGGPFVSLDLLTGNGSGGFSDTATYQTVGAGRLRRARPGRRRLPGLEHGPRDRASRSPTAPATQVTSTSFRSRRSGDLGQRRASTTSALRRCLRRSRRRRPRRATSWPPTSTAPASRASRWSTAARADRSPAGRPRQQPVPAARRRHRPTSSAARRCWPSRPFMGTAAAVVYRGPTSDPSTLVQNEDGSWTRTYPDGTVIQFNSSGQETSETDRNGNTFTYAYVTSGAAAGALATITDPVGLITTLAYNESAISARSPTRPIRVTTFTVDDARQPDRDRRARSARPPTYGYSTPSNHEATAKPTPTATRRRPTTTASAS